jgi:hypothetical protein
MKKIVTTITLVAFAWAAHAQNVGVGTTNPLAKFSVGTNSQFQVDSLGDLKRINNVSYQFPFVQGASGQVLGNNGNGQLSWVNQLGGWSLQGNANINPNYFIGTTDTMPLQFRVNNVRSGYIDQQLANTFWGANAGGNAAITFGSGNVAIGFNSLNNLTTGNSNVGIGINSLRNNTTGSSNLGIGANAIYTNTTGSSITAVGNSALYSNTSGSSNTGVGSGALFANTQGNSNSSLGHNSLYNNTLGGSNTAVGTASMFGNTIGAANTAIGNGALYLNQSGSNNTALGNHALYNSTAAGNVAVGHDALFLTTTAQYNTAVGLSALFTAVTSGNNTALGKGADISFDSVTNSTSIGNSAISTSSNQITLGNVNITNVRSAGTYGTLSDGRFKENVTENVVGLDFIMQLRPVTYTLNTQKFYQHVTQKNGQTGITANEFKQPSAVVRTGFIAQEVEAAATKVNYNFDGVYKPTNSTDNYSLSYAQFVVPLVKAVQELNAKIATQDELIKQLTKRLEALEAAKQ